MSLHLNVNYNILKMCLNIPSEHQISLRPLFPDFLVIQAKQQTIFCVTMTISQFTQFLNSKSLVECRAIVQLKNEVEVSGFGAQDQSKFEDFAAQVQECSSFVLQKKRTLINALNSLDFALRHNEPWFFSFDHLVSVLELNSIKQGIKLDKVLNITTPQYPFLYIHINNSVSFYRVDSNTSYKKQSGSIIGDSTIESLLYLIGIKEDLNQAFQQAFENGNNINVDLTVGDIYGTNVDFTLPKDLIASSMGKAQFQDHIQIKPLDVVKSLWNIFAINLGMLTAMMAQNENISTVICHSSKLTYEPWLYSLQVVIDAYGDHKLKIYFTEHSDYLNLLGL